MTNIEPTEQQVAWRMVERAWSEMWSPAPPQPPDSTFIIDESMLGAMLHDPRLKLNLTLPEMSAALEYWHTKMIESVEEVVARHRAEIDTAVRLSDAADAAGL